ncbi:hypothetical protein DAEQUDRAFT_738986 [Daedalea quercina L-15889]|uniref:Uncharacterized protein n=1 Tax=Daedalea quercina L-15889 TaxID=1314783 RepID=A0A165PDT4_9APHY|nr:hypothetical protein DAEQUDRAFT_738986 [Daedalea quercina L-15889]
MADVQDFSVEESRAKRAERLQSKYRNRGGVFKPATHNALLDILLSRGVNGESPSKRRKSRKSFALLQRSSEPPTIERRKSLKTAEENADQERESRADQKGKAKAASSRRKSQAPTKRKNVAGKVQKLVDEDGEDSRSVAGLSRTVKRYTKEEKRKHKDDADGELPKKATKRAAPKKATKATKKAQEIEDEVIDAVPPPKRTMGKRVRRKPDPIDQDSDEEPVVPPKRAKTVSEKPQAKSLRTNKLVLETIPEESDSEDDVPLCQVVRSKAAVMRTVVQASSTAKASSKPARPEQASKSKNTLSEIEIAPPSRRRKVKAVESDDDDMEDIAEPPSDKASSSRATRPEPPPKLKAALTIAAEGGDAAITSKRRGVPMDDSAADDVRLIASSSRSVDGSSKLLSTSKRKIPALPEPYVDSDEEPAPAKAKIAKALHKQTEETSHSATRSDARDDVSDSAKVPPSRRSASSASRKAAEETDAGRSPRIGASKKRERDTRAGAVQPTEDERDADDQPAPPRKRSKQSIAEARTDDPAPAQEEVDASEGLEEKPTAKSKPKSAARSKTGPPSQARAGPKPCVPQ